MIVDAIINLVTGVLSGLLGLLPTEPIAPDLSGMVESMFASDVAYWVRALSKWFPLDVLGLALGVLIGWTIALAAFRLVVWVLALLHIAGTEAA